MPQFYAVFTLSLKKDKNAKEKRRKNIKKLNADAEAQNIILVVTESLVDVTSFHHVFVMHSSLWCFFLFLLCSVQFCCVQSFLSFDADFLMLLLWRSWSHVDNLVQGSYYGNFLIKNPWKLSHKKLCVENK